MASRDLTAGPRSIRPSPSGWPSEPDNAWARAAAETARPAALGRLEITFMPLGPVTAGDARSYAGRGADRLLIYGFPAPAAGRLLEQHADLPR